MAISTNGTVLARVAGALYNTQMSNATYNEVKTLDPASLTDALYARDFSNATDAAVATTLVTNLGLTSVEGLVNWVAAQLTAAGSHKGAKIVDLLNGFAQMTADATYGAAATAFNTKVDAALVLSQTTGNAGGTFADAGVVVVAGVTFTLTTGTDAKTGGAGADTFNFDAINPTSGADATTLNSTDVIDGGAGNDTVNITRATSYNATLQGTFTNVEVININNTDATSATAVDASLFGSAATSIKQIGKAANVTKLASTTTAAIKSATLGANLNAGVAGAAALGATNTSTTGSSLSVAAASTSTIAAISLDSVKGDSSTANAVSAASSNPVGPVAGTAGALATVQNQAALSVNGAALNTVTVAGTLSKATTTTGANAATLKLDITTGKDVQTATVTSALPTTLSVTKSSDSTKEVTTVDASASTGVITYSAASTVGTIKTGAGKDVVTIATATVKDNVDTSTDETLSANVDTGAGDDKLTLNTSGAGNTTASTGDGKDEVTFTGLSTGTVVVNSGAGDDTLKVGSTTLTSKLTVNGGDGTDTVELAGSTSGYTSVAYTTLDNVFSNVETVKFTTQAGDASAATGVDASKLVDFTKIVLAGSGDNFIKAVSTQTVLLGGATDVTVTASGYVLDSDTTLSGNQTTYAGALNIAVTTDSSVSQLNSDTATVTISTDATVDADIATTVKGDLKSLTVALASSRDLDTDSKAIGTESLASVTVNLDPTTGNDLTLQALTTLTVTGSGVATINAATDGETSNDAAVSGKLTTIDLSGMTALVNLNVNADQVTGTTAGDTTYGYSNLSTASITLNNAVVETVKLGGAKDTVVTDSTYLKTDEIQGFELVALASDATAANTAKSDAINVAGATSLTFVKMTGAFDSLFAALSAAGSKVDASSNAQENVVFQYGGNTYVYVDASTNGLSDNDTVIKLAGLYDLDLLVDVIA